ncbi:MULTISPECIES: helix-turn-helix transcriptional regulator [Achromobacter]|uniref:Shikimate kinase n=1 Tax=Alcaligenes xylosoxydans xylosoxydans TaxID=85698 RepID=A0A424WD35_ALCXX|nr:MULTISPECIES: helix-turn-helix transcriptional regulator [Achromobacter]MBC9906286.1 helix-turn-helix transcriptional regulator [Achromobacter xylosoxidans]MBD0869952.1 helix-turn-helix transcriptional regulator [Achromobacter xylosoxidans]MDH1302548.1 helix-turn-helix transcriptional regulator [Achromobacter sp. GD03932]QNP87291.1 helix-turn-helix transcriptional regulator [Achromobacter xylosoxidans]RPJ91162.1 helix-turn-helix domain-containing protein [Achromobacter xylosoxidans]
MNQALDAAPSEPRREAFLVALGERVRRLRAIRGMTRKGLSQVTGVSERHLANLEHGVGNASILVLLQIARAFNCALAELVGDVTTESPDWLLIRELLSGRTESDLQRAREALTQLFGVGAGAQRPNRTQRVALIGLRGAGKSTLGQMLADDLGYPFVELNREIERVAGCSILEIHNLYGPNAYRRYERRALEEAVQIYPEMVLATPGGLVSEPATLNLLLAHCYTVWLRATPEEHMGRVMAQGDFRPMSGNNEAMADLKRILAGREAFYAKADLTWVTSNLDVQESFAGLRTQVRKACGLPL